MAEDWAEDTRTVDYRLAVEFELNERPGILYPLVGNQQSYQDKRGQLLDRFDDIDLEEKTARNGRTNLGDMAVERRYIRKPRSYNKAIIIDRDDMKSTKVDLGSPTAQQMANAVRRYHDDQFLAGFYGNAYIGEDGDTAVAFDANNIVAASANLETQLLEVRERMNLKDVDMEVEMPICLLDPKTETLLLSNTKYQSFDYNDGKPMPMGAIKPWLGFQFVRCNLTSSRAYPRGSALAVPAANQVALPVFVRSGLFRGVWTEFFGDITPRKDLSYSTQVFGEACSNVTRTNEDKCFQIIIDHA